MAAFKDPLEVIKAAERKANATQSAVNVFINQSRKVFFFKSSGIKSNCDLIETIRPTRDS